MICPLLQHIDCPLSEGLRGSVKKAVWLQETGMRRFEEALQSIKGARPIHGAEITQTIVALYGVDGEAADAGGGS